MLVERLIGPYTGRALTPLATIDLVGWDIHRAIVDNVYENTKDESHETLRLPEYMDKLMERGVLGNKTGRGFFMKEGKVRHVLDPVSGGYKPESEFTVPDLGYIEDVSALHREGRYRDALAIFLGADGHEAALARKVIAGYISYAFHRVGEVTEGIDGIDRIMGTGFNWAPPGVLADVMGAAATVDMIDKAGLPVPAILADAARTGEPTRFFDQPHINLGRFFVAG